MTEAAIEFTNFSHKYSDGNVSLTDISLTVGDGESVGLIGHNGSGKSTLLMHIVGILTPKNGVSVYGQSVNSTNLAAIRHRVGYVFQNPRDQLFMTTVEEDVAFGPLNSGISREEAMRAVSRSLELVGIKGIENRTSYHLSGGEMRRVAISTVLAMSPEIIVMDEPTSGLDPRGKRELAAVIKNLKCTKLIASHDLEFIRSCTDRVVLLHHGRVAAVGSSDEILDNGDLLLANGL